MGLRTSSLASILTIINMDRTAKLQELRQRVLDKKGIDITVLMDPTHADFAQKYALEDTTSEAYTEAIKLRSATRTSYIAFSFVAYHLIKTPLWHYGYGAHFFHRTRFTTIPLVFFAVWYSATKVHRYQLQEAGVLEYYVKRI